jgi:hypothetical protein
MAEPRLRLASAELEVVVVVVVVEDHPPMGTDLATALIAETPGTASVL